MENTDNFICFKCIHKFKWEIGCEAFPDGIVNQVLLSNKHDKPLPDQDNEIVFDEKKD
jgi:hypothetical protein